MLHHLSDHDNLPSHTEEINCVQIFKHWSTCQKYGNQWLIYLFYIMYAYNMEDVSQKIPYENHNVPKLWWLTFIRRCVITNIFQNFSFTSHNIVFIPTSQTQTQWGSVTFQHYNKIVFKFIIWKKQYTIGFVLFPRDPLCPLKET